MLGCTESQKVLFGHTVTECRGGGATCMCALLVRVTLLLNAKSSLRDQSSVGICFILLLTSLCVVVISLALYL
jgi:hypothetical protein